LPYGLFVNGINTVYMANMENSSILIRAQGNVNLPQMNFSNLNHPRSIFVSISYDIYVGNGEAPNHRVDKWAFNSTSNTIVMYINGSCYGLFVDINNTLYCSVMELHKVFKISLDTNITTPTVAAGNGSVGSASNMLNSPRGIFVHINLDLYVADCTNNRIQRVTSGQLNGTTMTGNGTSGSISLHCPTGITLDADDNLFIVDNNNNRIIRSGSNGFTCLVGCSSIFGSSSNQLNNPETLNFDSYGNMFVTDQNNSRVQLFILATNSCGK
jgi:tripartite motif-containing protein 71